MQTLEITQPDDGHLHVRDGATLSAVVKASAQQFGRAIIMPNLKPPVTTVSQAEAYYQRICAAVPDDQPFQPLMTLYLTDHTTPADIEQVAQSPLVYAVKYYPAGATTHSDAGVTDLRKVWPLLQAMADWGVPLLIHGEVTRRSIDVFDKEAVFIEEVLAPLLDAFPRLKVVLEHITTEQAVQFVLQGEDRLAATITAHHLLMNRNALFQGGIRPHHYCLPILKREQHRQALLYAISTGNPRFFLGTDSAPHLLAAKETACGCAGMYTAPLAMPLYAMAFESVNALDKLEAFASFYGADFYHLPRNQRTLTLQRTDWRVPDFYPVADNRVLPPYAGQTLTWQVVA